MLKEAFAVGVVLSAKDLYSAAVTKAQGQIRLLSRTSADEAAKFERNLKRYQTAMNVGLTVSAVGIAGSKFFERNIALAGEMETAVSSVLIMAGDQAEGYAARTEAAMSRVKTTWGKSDEEIAAAVKEIGGRTGDYEGALQAVGVAATLARARQMDMGEATQYLTTMVAQQSDKEKAGLTIQERYQNSAAKLAVIQKAVGSNWAIVGSGLGRITEKTTAAGISFDVVGALLMQLGRSGMSARAGIAPIEAMMDAMGKLPELPNFKEVFPRYAESGDLIDMLEEVKVRLDQIPKPVDKVKKLKEVFGEGAEVVLRLVQDLDGVRGSLEALETAKFGDVVGKANAQMETWAGTQVRLNTRIEEFREMLGEGAVPMVKKLENALGGLTEAARKSPFWGDRLRVAAGLGLVVTEAAKLAGPIFTAIVMWRLYHLQQELALANQVRLNVATGGGAAAVGGGAAARGVGGLATGVGLGLAGQVGAGAIVGTAQFAAGVWAGQKFAKAIGVQTFEEWYNQRARKRAENAPGARNFIVPEVVGSAENPRTIGGGGGVTINGGLNLTVPGYTGDVQALARKVAEEIDRRVAKDSLRYAN